MPSSVTTPISTASRPHFRKTRKTSSSRPFSATSSMRSCDLAEHDLVRRHAGFALRDAVQFDLDADFAAAAHFAGGAGEAGGAHVLNADDGAGLHGFEAGFEQQLFHERIAHLHVGALLLGFLGELGARPWTRRECRRGRCARRRRSPDCRRPRPWRRRPPPCGRRRARRR